MWKDAKGRDTPYYVVSQSCVRDLVFRVTSRGKRPIPAITRILPRNDVRFVFGTKYVSFTDYYDKTRLQVPNPLKSVPSLIHTVRGYIFIVQVLRVTEWGKSITLVFTSLSGPLEKEVLGRGTGLRRGNLRDRK